MQETLNLIALDIPCFVCALLVTCTGYRAVPLLRDLNQALRSPARGSAEPHSEARRVVLAHLLLIALDLITVPAALLILLTLYRLPKTLRKLGGANVWNREGRHWSRMTLRAHIKDTSSAALPQFISHSGAGKSSPRRANMYILKVAAKIIADVLLLGLLAVPAMIPFKTQQVASDVALLRWCETPEQYQRRNQGRNTDRERSGKPTGSVVNLESAPALHVLLLLWAVFLVGLALLVQYLFPSEPIADWSLVPSGSGSSSSWIGEEVSAESYDAGATSWIAIGAALSLLMVVCCCCQKCDWEYGCEVSHSQHWRVTHRILKDGIGSNQRQSAALEIAIYHFLLIPLDLTLEPLCMVTASLMVLTGWRASNLRMAAGPCFTVKRWESHRLSRYWKVLECFWQWLLDLPAVAMLVVLILSLLRAWPVLTDLIAWAWPAYGDRRRQQRRRAEFERLRDGLNDLVSDGQHAANIKPAQHLKFPPDLTAAAAGAERRLALAKLLSTRLSSESCWFDCRLPIEVLATVAKASSTPRFSVPAGHAPALDDTLAMAPPGAWIELQPGLHRITLGLLRSDTTLVGGGPEPRDVIVVPWQASALTAEANIGSRGNLKNMLLVREPRAIARRIAKEPPTVTQWRQLVWRNAALLVIDLPN
eukprot:SAG11_NODE_1280_length_5314_cov_2.956472_1_plen_649_part_00